MHNHEVVSFLKKLYKIANNNNGVAFLYSKKMTGQVRKFQTTTDKDILLYQFIDSIPTRISTKLTERGALSPDYGVLSYIPASYILTDKLPGDIIDNHLRFKDKETISLIKKVIESRKAKEEILVFVQNKKTIREDFTKDKRE